MLILGGRQQGLICSITRLIHFGRLSDELRQKQQATATVDATLIAHTRPGATLGEIFAHGQAAYAATGFGDEWQLHHQGGAAGYDGREYLGLPGAPEVVQAGQVFSWNPSITGTKSEDTVLVGDQGNEVLTAIAGWPTLPITVGNQVIERPAILEIKE